MGRITIKDLPEDHKIRKEEMKKVLGGIIPIPSYWMAYPPERSFLAEREIQSIEDIRRAGGLSRMEDLPVASDD